MSSNNNRTFITPITFTQSLSILMSNVKSWVELEDVSDKDKIEQVIAMLNKELAYLSKLHNNIVEDT